MELVRCSSTLARGLCIPAAKSVRSSATQLKRKVWRYGEYSVDLYGVPFSEPVASKRYLQSAGLMP